MTTEVVTTPQFGRELREFAYKNISKAANAVYSVTMVLLVLVAAAHNGHSVTSVANAPNEDTVFYRINTSVRLMQNQVWRQGLYFLRRKRKKLAQVKCYLTVDETYESYTGNLHKRPRDELTPQERTTRQYIHEYKVKRGDRGSFKYLVFALVYGKKRRVLRVKALKHKESYWLFVAKTLAELYVEVQYECALLDRGFYVAELVDQLRQDGVPYIIRARLCDTMRSFYGITFTWKAWEYKVAEWAETTLVLGRDPSGSPWGFLTNLEPGSWREVRSLYRKRWNIENIFKATDGIQLKVHTGNHVTRMFSVCLSFLLYNVWQNRNKRPTLLQHVKQCLEWLFEKIRKVLHYRDRLKLNILFWDFLDF